MAKQRAQELNSQPAHGAALARVHQALYRFGALAGAADTSLDELAAAAEWLKSEVVAAHPDPLVRTTWLRALTHVADDIWLDRTRFGPALFLERTLRKGVVDLANNVFELCLRAGVRPTNATPDDLTVELDLAAELCAQEAAAQDGGDIAVLRRVFELRRELLVEHLGPWLPVLRDVLEDVAPGPALLLGGLTTLCRFDVHRVESALNVGEGEE